MYTLPLPHIKSDHALYVGEKALEVAELISYQLPCPPGFVITTSTFRDYLETNGLTSTLQPILSATEPLDPIELEFMHRSLLPRLHEATLSKASIHDLLSAYDELKKAVPQAKHWVLRSSPAAPFDQSGTYPIFMNLTGEAALLERLKETYQYLLQPLQLKHLASLLTAGFGVIVQATLPAQVSGFAHTRPPDSNDKRHYLIEAIWGFGELLVQNRVKPDQYWVDWQTETITKRLAEEQAIFQTLKKHELIEKKCSKVQRTQPKLSDAQIQTLTTIIRRIHRLHVFPQTIEWVLANEQFFIVQRERLGSGRKDTPEQTQQVVASDPSPLNRLSLPQLVHGTGLCRGLASGHIHFVSAESEAEALHPEDIVVISELNPEHSYQLRHVAGVIMLENGPAGIAQALLQELGLPAISISRSDLTHLKNHQVITLDGSTGIVYQGRLPKGVQSLLLREDTSCSEHDNPAINQSLTNSHPITAKISQSHPSIPVFMHLPTGLVKPHLEAGINPDGICFLQGEILLAKTGYHPKYVLQVGKTKQLIAFLGKHLARVCEQTSNLPIFYRLADFPSTLGRSLKHGKPFEPKEPNPLLGFRGGYRALFNQDLFALELEMLRQVRERYPQVEIVLPWVRTRIEFVQLMILVDKHPVSQGSPKLWLELVSPANLVALPQLLHPRLSGYIVNTNELTKLMLGVDPAITDIVSLYNPADQSLLWLLSHAAGYSKKDRKPFLVFGEIGGLYPHVTAQLIRAGVTGFAVPPDFVHATRRYIKKLK